MVSESDKATREPGFSTLEVSRRGEYSTLEVNPQNFSSSNEVEPTKLDDPLYLVTAPQEYLAEPPQSEKKEPWWKRFWPIILVLSILVTGGIIGAAVGGTLASKKESNEKDDVEESVTASSHESTSTVLSKVLHTTSLDSSTTFVTSITTSWSSIKLTATPGANDAPDDTIWIGTGSEDGHKFHLGFAVDGTKNASCNYGIIPVPEADNPCSHPFLLPDGFQYAWEGCGGGTWMTWRNPSSDDPEYHMLRRGACEYKPRSFDCSGVDISAVWLCGNSTG